MLISSTSPQSASQSPSSHADASHTVSTQAGYPSTQSTEGRSTAFSEATGLSIGLLFLLGVLVIMRRSFRHWKALNSTALMGNEEEIRPTRLNSKLPCLKCHYFKPSYYLSCAVNPTTVLKPEAMNCQDFRPDSQDADEFP